MRWLLWPPLLPLLPPSSGTRYEATGTASIRRVELDGVVGVSLPPVVLVPLPLTPVGATRLEEVEERASCEEEEGDEVAKCWGCKWVGCCTG